MDTNDTICALATPAGVGAIAMIRLSGPESFGIIDQIFEPRSGSPVSLAAGYTLHLGNLTGDEGVIDEVMVSVFRQPHSYTADDAIEISCHGSPYIQQKIIELLISRGARMATAGEFTMRAFI
ncbi:MAG: tRNA uridine-5-carboxymethylaminomethyl(34) synthesis GTPase MnmE, partial [Bacteroidales bacterium]|nr:tRNA uridine-5-carboxymethylaminomethyl(34) synthesis GTPase MnmE [Bacteroidales bacterium]